MEINQTNENGDNNISFSVGGDFVEVKSFEDSAQIRDFYKRNRKAKILSYIVAILSFLLSPIYGYFIIKSFFNQ